MAKKKAAKKTAGKKVVKKAAKKSAKAVPQKVVKTASVSIGGKKLVIVESPTKAKTIRKFLGRDYVVESCMGHIRDLPQSARDIPEKFKKLKWAQLGVNVDEDFEPIYTIPKNKTKIVSVLKDKLKNASELYLATDEDREGESISWHLLEVLKPKVPVKRMVFHEITKEAIEAALKNVRKIDKNLVQAQEARRILDRLVGYTISPLLWKKVAYGLSAGRVQSVAVRLIVERELQRLAFKKSEYWSLKGECQKSKMDFEARLSHIGEKRVASGRDFDGTTGELLPDKKGQVTILSEKSAKSKVAELKGKPWKVSNVEEKPVTRKAPAPFITSTLQQESNRKLGMGAREAMRCAQGLYEKGLITYMRTDSTNLSDQAIKGARKAIKKLFGDEYLPQEPRLYKGKKVKGAQEAHEAIRPAGADFQHPEETGLTGVEYKMYEMIWMRTVASQMPDSRQRQVSVRFQVDDVTFTASGMTIEFPGYLKAYEEGRDEDTLEDRETRLPQLKEGDTVDCKKIEPTQHETKPPARFTEASLIQSMEKEGIGRPSTYAPTISTIMDRGYVRKTGNALVPTFTAVIVNNMLSHYLPQYVDLGFTSRMEESLDEIAEGDVDSLKFLKELYLGRAGLRALVEKQEKAIDPEKARAIKLDVLPGYEVRVGRYGAYVVKLGEDGVSASIPDSQNPADVTVEAVEKLIEQKESGADAIGKCPETGKPIYILTGRYGPYVQRGDTDEEKSKIKRVSIPPTLPVEEVDFKMALRLLELPKTLGQHPETGKDIKLGYGRFGPYVVHDGDFRSVPKAEFFLDTTLERALELFAQPKRGRGATPIKELGSHPDDGQKVAVFDGRYGPYVKWGKVNVSVPSETKPEDLSLEEAVVLLNAKASESKGKKGRGATAKA